MLTALNNGRPDRGPCQVHGWMSYYRLNHLLAKRLHIAFAAVLVALPSTSPGVQPPEPGLKLDVSCGVNVTDPARPPRIPASDRVTKEAGYDYAAAPGVAPWKFRKDLGTWFAENGELRFTIRVPEGDAGRLRLRFNSPKAEPRVQEVVVEGKQIGVFDSAASPGGEAWIEADYSAKDTADGALEVVVKKSDPAGRSNVTIAGFEVFGTMTGTSAEAAGAALTVLDGQADGAPAKEMMKRFLLEQVRTQLEKNEAERKGLVAGGPEKIGEWQKRTRAAFAEALGGLPLSTGPLKAEVTGTDELPGYRIERILIESQPGYYVTAVLFLPDAKKFPPPYPAVVVPCGHLLSKAISPYPDACVLLALNGVAGMIFDPTDQGERYQLLTESGKHVPGFGHMNAHMAMGISSIFVGLNTATFMMDDAMRCLDYLQSRKDIDGRHFGVMGNSGGGTQSAYLMALDDRIGAAAPSCFIHGLDGVLNKGVMGDSEQNIHAQLPIGLDHWTYPAMRAPSPVLVCAAKKDFQPIAGTRDTAARTRDIFEKFDAGDRIGIEEVDGKHGWHRPLQLASVKWMLKWLADKPDAEVIAPEKLDLPTKEQMQVTPGGEVLELPGAKSVYDIMRERAAAMRKEREALWQQGDEAALARVRTFLGIRPLEQVPSKPEDKGTVERDGYGVRKLVLRPEPGIVLPALAYVPEGKPKSCVLWMDDKGMTSASAAGGDLERLVKEGNAVVAVDLRGLGETLSAKNILYQDRFGLDTKNVTAAYMLGRSYLAMRTEDILAAAQAARTLFPEAKTLRLVARGEQTAVPALHAAALEPGLFESVEIEGDPESFEEWVGEPLRQGRYVHAVHGVLGVYDLPELRRSMGMLLPVPHRKAGR
jgi:dienelactone hydrolase